MDKTFITASDLLQDSFRLAAQIHRSGFLPDFIIGIWRGGTPVGIAIQEYFEYVGVRPDHIAVRTSAYVGIGERAKTIRVHGLHYIVDEANADDSLLIVDACALAPSAPFSRCVDVPSRRPGRRPRRTTTPLR